MRQELREMMQILQTDRPPVLRRSRSEDWLYATDFPAVTGRRNLMVFLQKSSNAGWEYTKENGWILMRKPAEEPPEGWYIGLFGQEAGCCLSLLERHKKLATDEPEPLQRMLIKAGEEGEKQYEAACACIHRDWAERLRRGEPLPAVNRIYFTGRKE